MAGDIFLQLQRSAVVTAESGMEDGTADEFREVDMGTGVDLEKQVPADGCVDGQDDSFSRDNQVIAAAGGAGCNSHSLTRSDTDLEFKIRMQPYQQQRKVYSKRQLLLLAFQTLGVVYGDMGTSPLYVYSSTALGDPQTEDFMGAFSIMFWTLTLIALVKYVLIVLRADDHGEGGSFAIYSKLCQHARIGQTAGRQCRPVQSDANLTFHGGEEVRVGSVHSRAKEFVEGSKAAQTALLGLVMLGTSMIIGDGVLTPVISVMSAVGGIKSSSVSQTGVACVSAAILFLLFMCQRFGTSKVAKLFSPIMLLWFLTIFMVGVYNVFKFYPAVFKALSPHYAVLFFGRNGYAGWRALSGLVLVITGTEAMFWDLGHFNRQSIELAFTVVVYPSLVLTYAGQTAFLIANPGSISNAFYDSIPDGLHWPVLIVSTLAAIVASQALISATFCVFKQAVALGCFPRVAIKHTSEKEEGQVYCPAANYMLMLLCLAVVLGFQDQSRIADAYGVAVLFDLVITTSLVTLVMLLIWQTSWPLILSFFCFFIAIEGSYLSSVLLKFAHGGWVPFGIAAMFMGVMVVWNYGRRLKHEYEVKHRLTPERLRDLLTSPDIQRVPGICFFYSDLPEGPPPVFSHYVANVGSLHQFLIFTTIRFIPVKHVPPSERYLVGKVGYGRGVYRCVARYGYKDLVDVAEKGFMFQVMECVQNYLAARGLSTAEEELELQAAAESGAVYVIGKSRLEMSKPTLPGCNCFSRMAFCLKRFVANHLYYLLQHNCRSAVEDMEVPHSDLLEVRMVYDHQHD